MQLSGVPEAPSATTRVLGTYAVQPDGRTPQNPAGQRLWTDLGAESFPSDAEQPTVRAHLVVADLATTAALAKATDDQLLWSAQSRLTDPAPRLAQFHRTADAVSLLRRLLTARSELADDPVALRPSIASGVEDLADRADVLSSAAQRGAAVTTRVGIALSLALVVAAAGVLDGAPAPRGAAGRRHRSAAGLGRPALRRRAACPAAVLAGVVGWFAARAVVTVTVGSSTPTQSALRSAGLWSAGGGRARPWWRPPWWPPWPTGWRPGASRAARRCACPGCSCSWWSPSPRRSAC